MLSSGAKSNALLLADRDETRRGYGTFRCTEKGEEGSRKNQENRGEKVIRYCESSPAPADWKKPLRGKKRKKQVGQMKESGACGFRKIGEMRNSRHFTPNYKRGYHEKDYKQGKGAKQTKTEMKGRQAGFKISDIVLLHRYHIPFRDPMRGIGSRKGWNAPRPKPRY